MTVRLIIAEKPNVAKAIAEALSGGSPRQNAQGLYEVGNDLIAACAGHILEQYDPEDYDEKLARWSLEDLPIIPSAWKLKPIPSSRKRLAQIRDGMKEANVVYNAADGDAEGQLLVDEVIEYLGWKGPVKRVVFSDVNPGPIKKAFEAVKDNSEFEHLSRKALSRSKADWLLGMNCSRLYSKLADKVGIKGVLSAGRVQSAVLGLVARRELEIKNFKPHDFFVVKLAVDHPKGSFVATWKPADEQPGLDSEGRLIDSDVLSKLKTLAPGEALILSAETQRKTQNAPLPYSLSDLQKAANTQHGMTMAEVLEIAQSLYDAHKLTTYPRTDTGYLPEDQHAVAGETLSCLANNLPDLMVAVDGSDSKIKSRAFNDAKVGAHHGIVPTSNENPRVVSSLNKKELTIYKMIAERYVAQFYPPAEFDATRIELGAPGEDGEKFVATGKVWIKQGWRDVNSDPDEENEGPEKEDVQSLPQIAGGDAVKANAIVTEQKKTKPPKPFTDATLLTAMTNIHRYVVNPAIKKMLKDNDGIGTEATRASIVDALIKRQLMKRDKRYILTTTTGMAHFALMPAELTTPDMASVFERDTRRIEAGEIETSELLRKVESFIRHQIDNQDKWLEKARKYAPVDKPSEFSCRNCSEPLYQVRVQKNKRPLHYFRCKNEECECCFRSDGGAPTMCFRGPLKEADEQAAAIKRDAILADAPRCSECENPLMRRSKTSKKGVWNFWTCETYKENKGCESIFLDAEGKPGNIFVRRGEKVERTADGPVCPECEKLTFTAVTKAEKRPILFCKNCDSMFDRNTDGSPGQPRKIKGAWVSAPADGPQCPECEKATRKGKTKKTKKPILICEGCDSMFWTKRDGTPLTAFKLRGAMVKRQSA